MPLADPKITTDKYATCTKVECKHPKHYHDDNGCIVPWCDCKKPYVVADAETNLESKDL